MGFRTLVPEPYPEENLKFMKENGITHYQIGMPGNNKGNPLADREFHLFGTDWVRVLTFCSPSPGRQNHHRPQHHPEQGKPPDPDPLQQGQSRSPRQLFEDLTDSSQHRTGCVVGCLRRFQAWTIPRAIEEYRKYAGVKSRPRDMAKIGNYSLKACYQLAYENGWIPATVAGTEWYEDVVEEGGGEFAVGVVAPSTAIRAQ